MNKFTYVLITPAHNEDVFIERTINSVIHQTILPLKWVIVDDGSSDNTFRISKSYSDKYDFIDVITIEKESKRTFASKVRAFNYGFEKIKNLEFDFIGNLDADVTFEPDYYEHILNEFEKNNQLGIAGGDRYDLINGKFERVSRSSNSVSGAVQLFRSKCFAEINGYRPLEYGGIDAVAESMARFAGWEVWTFSNIIFYHHRRTGTAQNNILNANFKKGIKEYLNGYHPVFEILRIITNLKTKPVILGSLIWLAGFIWAAGNRYNRPVSKDFVKNLRKEQMNRLKLALTKKN